MKTYSIEIQNPKTGEVDTREYTMVSTSSLRSRTAALRFQKSLLDLKLLKEVAITSDNDEDKVVGFDTALKLVDLQHESYRDLCTNILIGDWTDVDFSLLDETVINQVLTDFFSLYNSKNAE